MIKIQKRGSQVDIFDIHQLPIVPGKQPYVMQARPAVYDRKTGMSTAPGDALLSITEDEAKRLAQLLLRECSE